MLRLVGFLVMATVGAGGVLVVDYNMARNATAEQEAPLSFGEYLEGIPERVASATASVSGDGLPRKLDAMLPRAPEGWTQRPTTKEDIAGFQPRKGTRAEKASQDLVASVGSTRAARGAEVVIATYENGDRRVTIQLIRHPDKVFSGLAAREKRFDLRVQAAERRGRPFLTARGLDVSEEFLGDGMRARYFFASVGAQIQIRVLATKRMKDTELLPFFETLHVEAMNASVVDRVEGLGEVPVIVLASALAKAEREAYEADRAARAEAALVRARDLRDADEIAARAEAGADAANAAGDEPAAKPTAGFASDCTKAAGGIKRCNVGATD